jgi:hypothetical protein
MMTDLAALLEEKWQLFACGRDTFVSLKTLKMRINIQMTHE